jgi:hypothetical protein
MVNGEMQQERTRCCSAPRPPPAWVLRGLLYRAVSSQRHPAERGLLDSVYWDDRGGRVSHLLISTPGIWTGS